MPRSQLVTCLIAKSFTQILLFFLCLAFYDSSGFVVAWIIVVLAGIGPLLLTLAMTGRASRSELNQAAVQSPIIDYILVLLALPVTFVFGYILTLLI